MDMITNKMICLFFTIAAFLLVTTKGDYQNCSLWIVRDRAPHMPLAYKVNSNQQPSIIYPNSNGRLLLKHNEEFTVSCASSRFALEEFQNLSDITISCVRFSIVKYQDKNYQYADLKCQYAPKSKLRVTDIKCQPFNKTVIVVGFYTQKYFFPLYNACFDMQNQITLYTWYNVRRPFYNKHEPRPRSRLFTMVKYVFRSINVHMRYTILEQQKTLNKILKYRPDSRRLINSINFVSRGHLASMPEFHYAREQRATFNYVNVVPQWKKVNEYWSFIEKAFRQLLPKYRNNRRVIVSGTYGMQTLPDADNIQQTLYLAMPMKQLPVPMFLWRLIYDADIKNNSFVYIGMNNPYAEQKQVDDAKLRCDEIPCPLSPDKLLNKTKIFQLYCCTIESFERAYGKFGPEVFGEPRVISTVRV